MGIDVYTLDEGEEWETFVLVCNTSSEPFGKVFNGNRETGRDFLAWLSADARMYADDELETEYYKFIKAKRGEE